MDNPAINDNYVFTLTFKYDGVKDNLVRELLSKFKEEFENDFTHSYIDGFVLENRYDNNSIKEIRLDPNSIPFRGFKKNYQILEEYIRKVSLLVNNNYNLRLMLKLY